MAINAPLDMQSRKLQTAITESQVLHNLLEKFFESFVQNFGNFGISGAELVYNGIVGPNLGVGTSTFVLFPNSAPQCR